MEILDSHLGGYHSSQTVVEINEVCDPHMQEFSLCLSVTVQTVYYPWEFWVEP